MPERFTFNQFILTIGLILLFTVPELNNVHYDPQPQFWAEISVAWAILGLLALCLLSLPQISLPAISIPLFIFAIYLCLERYFITLDYPGLNWIAALELGICIMGAIVINSLRLAYGLKFIVQRLSYALLIGACLQSLIGLIQYCGFMRYFGSLIFYDSAHPTTNIFGHFGQRNHYAHYLSWASFALIYLYHQRRLATITFAGLLGWFCFSLTIAASRSVFLYFGLALIISGLYYWRQRNADSRRLLILILIANLSLLAMEYFYPLLHNYFAHSHSISSGLQRLDSEGGTGRRGVEWEKAWLTFKTHPLFGVGWNGYAAQSVALHPLFPKAALNSGLFTNCHNLFLQIAAETGAVGLLIIGGGLLWVLLRMYKSSASLETIILYCLIGTTLAHSMNEYPLWYLYFLAGLICFLAVDKPILTFNAKAWRMSLWLPIVAYSYLMISYSLIFDRLVDYSDAPNNEKSFQKQAKYLANLVDHDPLAAYLASYSLDNYINVDSDYTNHLLTTQQQYNYTQRLVHFHPYPDTLIKAGMLAWNLRHHQLAKSYVESAVVAFPVYKNSFKDTLSASRYRQLRQLVD